MTDQLITVNPEDKLSAVKQIFEENRIHHIPVVRFTALVGMISKSDLLHFTRGIQQSDYDKLLEQSRLNNYTVQDIMTKKVARIESSDRIEVAIEVFKENLFHAIPVVENDELVGILTTFDIIKQLAKEHDDQTTNT